MFIDSIEKSALVKKAHKDSIEETKLKTFIDSIEKFALVRKNHKDSIEETETLERFSRARKKIEAKRERRRGNLFDSYPTKNDTENKKWWNLNDKKSVIYES